MPTTLPADKLYFRIGEVAEWLEIDTYVIRYWETEFSQFVRPERSGKDQRVYTRRDIVTLALIKELLKVELYTIPGAKRQLRRLRELGV